MSDKNIGYVLYQKGREPGTLEASWCHLSGGQGTGKATGGPSEGFEGHYHIQYFDHQGRFDDEFEIQIRKFDNCYEVNWLRPDGAVACVGVGMEVSEGLAIGWKGATI